MSMVPNTTVRPSIPGQPNGLPNQPNVQPTGLPYGQNQQLHQAQAQAPIPNTQGSQLDQALHDARTQMPSPQQVGLTPLDAPTERPNEHVMTGAQPPNGIGPPAGGMQAGPQVGQNAMADLLDQMAQASGSSALAEMAQKARAGA